MGKLIKRFGRDQDGATAIEYGLIAALIAVSAIAAFTLLGNGLENLLDPGTSDVITNQTDKL